MKLAADDHEAAWPKLVQSTSEMTVIMTRFNLSIRCNTDSDQNVPVNRMSRHREAEVVILIIHDSQHLNVSLKTSDQPGEDVDDICE